MQSICVFCGSHAGADAAYVQAARQLGGLLAAQEIRLIYGGGRTGMMGALADGSLAAGGTVIGVIPEAMNRLGVAHPGLTRLMVTDSMHSRKATMFGLSDAFIALPGGMGTLDELFETLTWSQLGYQPKPVGILNVQAYYDPLIQLIDHGVEHGFILPNHRRLFVTATTPAALIEALRDFVHPAGSKWGNLLSG